MRTNVTLDDDIHQLASMYAAAKGITLGSAIGELIRKAQTTPPNTPHQVRQAPNGFPLFPRHGRVITSAMVKEALEEEID
jgi:hypothetical protein